MLQFAVNDEIVYLIFFILDQIQRLQETWSNQNSFTIEDVNSFFNRGSALPKQVR